MKNNLLWIALIVFGFIMSYKANAATMCEMKANKDELIGVIVTGIASGSLHDWHITMEYEDYHVNSQSFFVWIAHKFGYPSLNPDPTFKCDSAEVLGAYRLKFGYPIPDAYWWGEEKPYFK